MDQNAGYSILYVVTFDNNRGFVFGESATSPATYVTWQFTVEDGKRDYYWGHYHSDRDKAEADFAERIEDYKRRYHVKEIGPVFKKSSKAKGKNKSGLMR